ncbi:MAG: hypothetical protein ACD_56C00156G0004 [uncultured bacterium]|nr:MAG: hypothetical protein ACD_56C00156G0004 [uncultured bacterium]
MKTIVWDLDDVLNELTKAWFIGFRRSHPKAKDLDYSGLKKNPPHDVLGISHDDFLRSLDDFRRSPEGKNLLPNAEIHQWLEKHGSEFQHIVLTATPAFNASQASFWVFTHFGKWIRFFGYVPSPRKDDQFPVYFSSKGDYLKWLGHGDLFVDDSKQNLQFAEGAGIKTLLFPQPWNDSPFESISPFLKELESILITK